MGARHIAAALLVVAGPALAQNGNSEFARGAEEYMVACAACHGEQADGNGPIATMFKGVVPDLRKITASNDGEFPTLKVFQIIDGRSGVAAHGAPMPIFGNRYKVEAGDIGAYGNESAVRARVLELVYYLESIQE